MAAVRLRAVVIERDGHTQPCASCEARPASVCSAIDEGDLARLAGLAVQQTLAAGETLIVEGDPAEHFFNITAGALRLTKTLPDGRRQITGFAFPGHFLGLAVSSAYAFSAEAIEAARLCRFSRGRLRALMDDFPALERRLLQAASSDLVAAQEQLLLLGRKTARERMASFLLGALAHPLCPAEPTPRVALPMSRQDIADYLGLTIETVSRTFTRLRAEGLIALPAPSQVVVLRRPELQAIADGLV